MDISTGDFEELSVAGGAESSPGVPLDNEAVADTCVRFRTLTSAPNPQRTLFSEPPRDRQDTWNTPVPNRFVTRERRRNYTYRTRRPASPPQLSTLRARRLENANTTENPFKMVRKCCMSRTCFSKVDKIFALNWYRRLMTMEREQRKATLISWYNREGVYYEFGGRRVCWEFLRQAFGFSNDLLSDLSGNGSAGAQTSFAQPRDVRKPTFAGSIITFLRLIADACGEKMPHRPFINLSFTCRESVYQIYVEYFHLHDLLRFSRDPPKISYFYHIWKKHVSDVKTLQNTGFEKCSECVFFRDQRAKNILNPMVLRELKAAAKQHYDDTKEERRGYELRKQLSCLDPNYYLSLVIDGADQSNYGLPHFVEKSKDDRGHKIAVKIVGVLMHGVENQLFLYSMVKGFETGANHVIESLHRALNVRKKKTGKLPAIFYVQADNCTRENKNRYFLGYLEMLVALGVFMEVQLSTMAVGHTHTDVDQSFSCVHKRLDKQPALSLSELHKELEKSHAPPPHVEELSRVANFSVHCTKNRCLEKVSEFSQCRYSRFVRRSNNAENGIYKTKCTVKINLHDEWRNLRGVDISGFLKSCPDLMRFPTTKTRVLPNVREVNACLRAAEVRIESELIMKELYTLRDRVYTENEYEAGWTEDSFELHGDYAPAIARVDPQSFSQYNDAETDRSIRFRYEIGDFVAIKPEAQYNTAFWIAQVLGFGDVDGEGYPLSLEGRWYVAGSGEDPLTVTYKPGFNGSQPWVADVHVDTVMLRFNGLTRRNRLRRETANKLSRSLGTRMQ